MNKIDQALLESMAEFCHRHFYFLDKELSEYVPLLKWFHEDGRLSVIHDDQNNIYALGLFRFLNDPNECFDEYFHDENGKILFVDAWIDPASEHGQIILESVKRRANGQKKFSFVRGAKQRDGLRTFPIETMETLRKTRDNFKLKSRR